MAKCKITIIRHVTVLGVLNPRQGREFGEGEMEDFVSAVVHTEEVLTDGGPQEVVNQETGEVFNYRINGQTVVVEEAP